MGYSKKEKEKRMAFLLPVAWGLSWGWGLLMGACGVGAAIAAGSVLRNTNNGGFHIPLIHRNHHATSHPPAHGTTSHRPAHHPASSHCPPAHHAASSRPTQDGIFRFLASYLIM